MLAPSPGPEALTASHCGAPCRGRGRRPRERRRRQQTQPTADHHDACHGGLPRSSIWPWAREIIPPSCDDCPAKPGAGDAATVPPPPGRTFENAESPDRMAIWDFQSCWALDAPLRRPAFAPDAGAAPARSGATRARPPRIRRAPHGVKRLTSPPYRFRVRSGRGRSDPRSNGTLGHVLRAVRIGGVGQGHRRAQSVYPCTLASSVDPEHYGGWRFRRPALDATRTPGGGWKPPISRATRRAKSMVASRRTRRPRPGARPAGR